MGNKLYDLKFYLTLLMSALATFIIYLAAQQEQTDPNLIYLLSGILFVVLGNYFQTIKPNYFIGIKTPWTLESDEVWKKTCKIGGRIWLAGGIAIVISCLLLDNQSAFVIFMLVLAVLVIVPVVYSYFSFKNLNTQTE